jgi:hypothetical protein
MPRELGCLVTNHYNSPVLDAHPFSPSATDWEIPERQIEVAFWSQTPKIQIWLSSERCNGKQGGIREEALRESGAPWLRGCVCKWAELWWGLEVVSGTCEGILDPSIDVSEFLWVKNLNDRGTILDVTQKQKLWYRYKNISEQNPLETWLFSRTYTGISKMEIERY